MIPAAPRPRLVIAPRFTVNEQRGAGHTLSVGHMAAAYHWKVLSFAEECVVARENPGIGGKPVATTRNTQADLEAG